MRKTLTLLTLVAATAASAATTIPPEGYTYRPLVEEGKRWTYVVPQPYAEENNLDIFKIEGDTLFQDATWKKLWFLDENEKSILPFPVALLREENKLVYMYPVWNASNAMDTYNSLKEDIVKYFSDLFSYLVFDEGGFRYQNMSKEEIDKLYPSVLYDFNLNPGDNMDTSMFWPWSYSYWIYDDMEFTVYGGFEKYTSDFTRFIELPLNGEDGRICDGLGWIGRSFFICPCPGWTDGSSFFTHCELSYSPRLQSVTTSDGQDLYRSDAEKGLKSPNWLNENYVWVYESREEGVLTERFYRLDGKENVLCNVDENTGKEYRHSYHRLILSREKRSHIGEDGTLSVISDTEKSEPVAYLDMTHGDPMGLEEIMVRFRTGDEISPEVKLYDWFPRISKEDLKFSVPGSDRSLYEKINSRGRLIRDDYEFEVYWSYPTSNYQNEHDGISDDLYPRPIVKGIGNCGFGLLHDVGSEEALKFRFSRLTDREGNVIVTSDDIRKLKPVPDSVESVAETNPIRVYGDRIEAASADGATVTLTVVSADGRTVAQTSGEGSVTLYTDQLPQGVYIVRSESGVQTCSAKIVR